MLQVQKHSLSKEGVPILDWAGHGSLVKVIMKGKPWLSMINIAYMTWNQTYPDIFDVYWKCYKDIELVLLLTLVVGLGQLFLFFDRQVLLRNFIF